MIDTDSIPNFVKQTISALRQEGFEAYLVGGCVRDLLLKKTPKDWDITTSAKPNEIQGIFPHTVYENSFGTVGVVWDRETQNNETLYDIVEVTPYRLESGYSDKRHPDHVSFSNVLEDDLKRRDFTVNALAFDVETLEIKDFFKGQEDLKDKVLRTVGNPDERFTEDALRMLRAIRFSVQLGFSISHETFISIEKNKNLLEQISWERKRDEFTKMIMSTDPVLAIGLLERSGLLEYIIPELREGIGCEQKGAHIYDVFEHLLHALGHAADKGWPLEIRLAALFHDIGKPRTRRYDTAKYKYTFFGHEVVGARMTKKILERLKFSRETIELVTRLVRYHMFFSDTDVITLSAVRRMIQNVDKEHIWELMQVRECDRVGMKKKEAPIRLRKYHVMIEEALRDPISVSALAIDGNHLMNTLGVKPGPRMGWILHALLEDVLDNPENNTIEILNDRVKQLNMLSDTDLRIKGEEGKHKKEEENEKEIEELQKKHGIKK